MQLIMGMSADGYVSIREEDDMKWLGPDDKKIFKLITLAVEFVFVSQKTSMLMPPLPGRKVIPLSTKRYGISLENIMCCSKNSILIGGQTIALAALGKNMIRRAHICKSIYDAPKGGTFYQREEIMKYVQKGKLITSTQLESCVVETWDL